MITLNDLPDVGHEYLAAVHDPTDPDVADCYAHLIIAIKHQFTILTRDLGLIVTTTNRPLPNDAKWLFRQIRTGELPVWLGGSPPLDHPLAGRSPGVDRSFNTMFRAVHDFFGHFMSGADFSHEGELLAYQTHLRTITNPLARKALFTETVGQLGAHYVTGIFADQKACIIN